MLGKSCRVLVRWQDSVGRFRHWTAMKSTKCFVNRPMPDNSFGYDMESVASNYYKYRPIWPPKLYEMILSYLDKGTEANDKRSVAIDAGCGSGQCTRDLCKHFKSVIGIDTSEAQLHGAKWFCADHKNVEFKLLAAEHMSSVFQEDSVELIMSGVAMQFFKTKPFYAECVRVLKSSGALAAFSWQIPTLDNEEANDIFHHQIFRGIFERYYPPESHHIFQRYEEEFSSMKLYFEDTVRNDSLKAEYNFSVDELFGFMKSFPQYFYYKADHPEHPDFVDSGLERLMEIYKATSKYEKVAKGSSHFSLILGRKPSSRPTS